MRSVKRCIVVVCLAVWTVFVRAEESDSAIIANFLSGFSDLYQKAYSSRILPADSVDSSVMCELSVRSDSLRVGSAIMLVLECNHRPDAEPPIIVANGRSIRPRSNSSSTVYSNGETTSCYRYFYPLRLETDGHYEFRCKDLSFDNIARAIV